MKRCKHISTMLLRLSICCKYFTIGEECFYPDPNPDNECEIFLNSKRYRDRFRHETPLTSLIKK